MVDLSSIFISVAKHYQCHHNIPLKEHGSTVIGKTTSVTACAS